MESKPPNVTVEYYCDTQSQIYIRLFYIETVENSLFDILRGQKYFHNFFSRGRVPNIDC